MSDMTVAQALRLVKKLKGRLAEATTRAQAGVSYKLNQKPAFSFSACIEQAGVLRKELMDLNVRVRITNATTYLEHEGRNPSLAEAVETLQELKGQISWFKGLPVKTQEITTENDWSYNEAGQRTSVQETWHCDLPEAKRAAEVDKLQDQFDRLNDAVERVNHVTVLKTRA